ncbi:HTH_Tnp_Tc3_2 domain-containing protein [Trichonephila clavipes]|uniref:HTH_Tnp_Tc3_2 domain-containing protein n=1 Tax=Trichonephila clavipes TaxID=2585209 RepID=A0A8X6VDC9_TRICX|nr:HTH_Tnp_Tc3_2 domain-containing protein [Trichonephila clavipes]
MSFARRPGSRRLRQTSRREDRHILRKARVQPTASSATIQAQVAPSLVAPMSSRTIRRRLDIWDPITCAALDEQPSIPLLGVVPRTRKLDCHGMEPGRL